MQRESLVGRGVPGLQIVTVVRGQKGEFQLPGNLDEPRHDLFLLRDTVVLDLDVEAVREEVPVVAGGPTSPFFVPLEKALGNLAV